MDRHLEENGNKAALIWQGEPEKDKKVYTYNQLHKEVCKFANILKKLGTKKGDKVCIYLPMIPELPIAMLACTRIGAIHSVVFGGYSANSMAGRVQDSRSKLLITSDGIIRGGKVIPLKNNVDKELPECKTIRKVVVVKRAKNKIKMKKGRDLWWHEVMKGAEEKCNPIWVESEHPAFILYTSGTTGKPKGVIHATGGYLTYVYQTFKWIFDIREDDIYWCTADIGWITGHSYILYGPLANCATSLMFEGTPLYPEPDRSWEIVDKYKVTIFYTAPTLVRALMREGDNWPKKHKLSSLRLLGSVGEPINPEAWLWYHRVIGKGRCPIVDTWWQTETGGILITPLPGAMTLKPGSASKPFFGVVPEIYNENGKKVKTGKNGYMIIKKPWPSMIRAVYRNPKRYRKTYFSKFPGVYLTGDGARVDQDGDFWIMGRLDDVINVSGHRLGTAEIESALVSHRTVAEAAVVPIKHKIKGQGIYAFITLKKDVKKTKELETELRKHVGKEIGHIAKPDKMQFADALPKTRSGKIMRRVLKAIAEGEHFKGDVTTLANPKAIDILFKERVK